MKTVRDDSDKENRKKREKIKDVRNDQRVENRLVSYLRPKEITPRDIESSPVRRPTAYGASHLSATAANWLISILNMLIKILIY